MSLPLSTTQLSAVLALEVLAIDIRKMGLPPKAEFQVLEQIKSHVLIAKQPSEPAERPAPDSNIQAAHLEHLAKLKEDWK